MNIIEKLTADVNYKFQETIDKPITFDSSCIRIGKKNPHVWIYAHEWEHKGNVYQYISYGSWKDGITYHIKSWDKELEKDKNFIKAYKQKSIESKAKIDLDVQRKNKECILKWKPIFDACPIATEHEYLTYKNVKPYGGIKIDKNGVLLIPCKDINGFTGVQRIYKDPSTNSFDKRFSSGIKIRGSIHALKPIKDAKFIYLSEGYATAATIQELYPEIPSICCFNASNIPRAIETIRHYYPNVKIIIAADNDHAVKDNPGLKYAKQSVHRFKQVIYKYPQFSMKNAAWTDFNDLAEFESREKAIEQLAFSEDEFAQLICLGHNDGTYFYMSSENQQIVSLSWAHHNKAGLRRLFANKAFWLKNYGVETDDDVKVNYEAACDDLANKCHEKGIFDPSNVRGVGVWIDGNRYVINDGEKITNANPDSIFNYQKTIRVNYSFSNYDNEMMPHLLNAFKQLEYKNKKDYFYLAAWLTQSYVFGVMPWRFHIWVTGSAGAGKSTILKWLHELSINNILTNNTTAAGIRQKAKSDAVSVIYDEAEPTESRTKDVLNLAREMSSNGDYESLRGSISGNSISHNTQCVLCFGSIQVFEFNQAESTRIFTIEMNSTSNQSPEHFTNISETFEYFIMNKQKIFSWVFDSIDSIKWNANFCKNLLKTKHKMESRLADQLSVAMAFYIVYFTQDHINEEAFDEIVKEFSLVNSDYTQINETKEHELCYDDLMSVILDPYTNTTVAQAIHNIRYQNNPEPSFDKMLGVHGLRYYPNEEQLFISNKNTHLSKKMPRYSDITRILKRDKSIILVEKDRVVITQLGYVRGIRIKIKL